MVKLSARSALGSGKAPTAPLQRVTPQNNLASVGRADAVLIRELPFFGCIDLRLDARNAAAGKAVADTLGAALAGPNSWVAASGAQILWQAYDEWLLIAEDGSQGVIGASLRSALAGIHCAVTDVSDLRAAFGLQGPRARDVLQKGCAVDLHPRVFDAGSCVNAALAPVPVTLRQMDAEPTYEELDEPSFASYLWTWLADAAAEYV
jgi:sarcosine oxidase subunit gamma